MADNVTVKITGIEGLRTVLADIPLKLRKKVLLGALRKAARAPLLAARQSVPVMSAENAANAPYRTRGLLKKRLMVRTSKTARRAGDVGVFVNVKPAKRGGLGAKNPLDPYYWRFVEFDTKKKAARPFLKPAADKLPESLDVFMNEVIPQINKMNAKK